VIQPRLSAANRQLNLNLQGRRIDEQPPITDGGSIKL
jgi:hypothetical protein